MRRANRRGMALLMVVIAIAILTVIATDFAYNSRVDLQLAANERDEIRAYYLAKSGVGFARLVLKFQHQLDATPIPGLGGMLSMLGPIAGAAQGGAPPLSAASSLNLQIWRLLRINCQMLQGLIPEEGPRHETAPPRPQPEGPPIERRSFGTFDGCFNVTIGDEEQKINLTRLDAPALSSQPVILRLLDLFSDKRFSFLFEEPEIDRARITPQELVINLKDWIDEDEVQSTLNLTGQGELFLPGFADEAALYDRYRPPYRPKNARFDTLDELYQVHGFDDRMMAAFGDRLTVYPDVNARLNVNTDDPMLLYLAILSVADPLRPDPRLRDPVFIEEVIRRIRAARMFSFLGTGVADFVSLVQAAGIRVNDTILNNVPNNRFVSDRSNTFSIRSIGEAGTVKKTIRVVVRTDDQIGKLLYWRED